MTPVTDPERERTAWHEAGHAVMAFVTRVRIDRITIVPDEHLNALGLVITSNKMGVEAHEPDFKERFAQRIEDFILVAMGGMAAVMVKFGEGDVAGGQADIAFIEEAARTVTHSDRERELYLSMLMSRCTSLLAQPDYVVLLDGLAARLLADEPVMSGKRAMEFLKQANEHLTSRAMKNIEDSLNR